MSTPVVGAWLVALGAAVAGLVVGWPWIVRRRRAQLRALPLPPGWARLIEEQVPLVKRLPPALRERLDAHLRVFLADKAFVGCRGQQVGLQVRLTIAAQACMLLLGQEHGEVFPRLRQVLVYPGPFIVRRRQWLPGGVLSERAQALVGESWGEGQVVLAWSEVLSGAADPDDGRNVVLHEFAHQVDQDGGAADGRPWQARPADAHRFARAMEAARAAAQRGVPHPMPGADVPPLFDDYALGDPAEFFAVATEIFFERPAALQAQAPAVADELARLYGVDPRRW